MPFFLVIVMVIVNYPTLVPGALPAKQSVCDSPGVAAARALVSSNLSTSFQLASFRAASSPHSGDWLFALPLTPCGLRLHDEAARIAVSARLGMSIFVPHNCHCESLVDAHGLPVSYVERLRENNKASRIE